jgi:hypothetical protein
MWILKIILLSFLRLAKSKQFFTKHLKENQKPLLFQSLAQECTIIGILVENGKELPVKQVFS